jgi:hypothetical protein
MLPVPKLHALALRRLPLCLMLITGCDPVMSVRGHVRSIPDASTVNGDVYASGKPIAGARVTLLCKDYTLALGTTDVSGRFRYAGIDLGRIGLACKVECSAAGYHPQTLLVRDLCVFPRDDSCPFLTVIGELVPKTTAAGAATRRAPD